MDDEQGWDRYEGELFRYTKGGRIRAYSVKVISPREAELWVVSESGGAERKSRRLTTFASASEAGPFLEDIQRELRSGGWIDVSR